MTGRRSWLGFVAIAVVALVALLAAGTGGRTVRTFALGSPNSSQVAALAPRSTICEGPVRSDGPVGAVAIWGAAIEGNARLALSVRDAATRTQLASGLTLVTQQPAEYTARLNRPARAGRLLSVCVTNHGPQSLSLLGSAPVHPGILAVVGRRTLDAEFSLVLLGAGHPSELGSLGTVFRRAALWRPSWVGTWTFWLLVAGLLGAIPLGALAVRAACAEDEPAPSAASTPRQ